jgi:hypothetical protein
MTRKILKLIILMIILMICSLLIQLYSGSSDKKEFFENGPSLSANFINLIRDGDGTANQIVDTDNQPILNSYDGMTQGDAQTAHTTNQTNLYNEYVEAEQIAINTALTGDPDIKIIYLNQSAADRNSDSTNVAGEFIRQIAGACYVWQPLQFDMFSTNSATLQTRVDANADDTAPYLECWVLEEARSGSYTAILDQGVRDDFYQTRPNQADIANYISDNNPMTIENETDVNNLTYFTDTDNTEKLTVGDKKVTFMGYRRDGTGAGGTRYLGGKRIFDQPSSMVRIPSGNGSNNRGNYAANKNTAAYKQYILDSVNYMNNHANNPGCFGLQWKRGELFWSESPSICKDIFNRNHHNKGWPHGWALDVYKIEDNPVAGGGAAITYNFCDEVTMTINEAETRRSTIKRNNNTTLILEQDLN